MIGLALVTLVAVLAQGIRSTFLDSVDEQFIADYAITAQDNFSPLPVEVEQRAEDVRVTAASRIRFGEARIDGSTQSDRRRRRELPKTISDRLGRRQRLGPGRLGMDGAIVRRTGRRTATCRIGSPRQLLTPSGSTLDLRVVGIFDEPTGGSPFANVNISAKRSTQNYEQPTNGFTFVNMRGGVTEANTRRLDLALTGVPEREGAGSSRSSRTTRSPA